MDKRIPNWGNTRPWHFYKKSKGSSKIRRWNKTLKTLFHLNPRPLTSLWYYKFHKQRRLQKRIRNNLYLKTNLVKVLARGRTNCRRSLSLPKNKKLIDLKLNMFDFDGMFKLKGFIYLNENWIRWKILSNDLYFAENICCLGILNWKQFEFSQRNWIRILFLSSQLDIWGNFKELIDLKS